VILSAADTAFLVTHARLARPVHRPVHDHGRNHRRLIGRVPSGAHARFRPRDAARWLVQPVRAVTLVTARVGDRQRPKPQRHLDALDTALLYLLARRVAKMILEDGETHWATQQRCEAENKRKGVR
jgi:hypothetical protein